MASAGVTVVAFGCHFLVIVLILKRHQQAPTAGAIMLYFDPADDDASRPPL